MRLDHPKMKSPTVRRHLLAILGGLALALIVPLISVYKGSPTVSSFKALGWGSTYCGRIVRLKGTVLLLNGQSSMYLLQDLNDSVAIEILLGKDARAPERDQLVEVRGLAVCRLFGGENAIDRQRTIPSYVEEFSQSSVDRIIS